jgi:pimeloyl-ACP methyl ester carboxylesterase
MSTLGRILALAALICAGAGARLYAAYRRALRAAEQRLDGASSMVATRSGPVEYAETGSGAPLLIVHGSGGGFDQGMELAGPLAPYGFRAIAMSRLGYLRTPIRADASPAAQADAHADLLAALGVERAAILGASAGAPSALQFAIRHPKRCTALVLLVPMTFKPSGIAGSAPQLSPAAQAMLMTIVGSDLVFWLTAKLAPQLVIRTVLATPPALVRSAPPDEQARVHRIIEQILPISRRREGLLNEARISSSLTRYELESITAPTLVLSVRDDLYGTYASAQYTAGQIPGAEFVGYASGGHVWVGHHQQVISRIAAFLTSATGRSA